EKLASAAKWLRLVGAKSQSTRLLAIRPLLALVWGEPSDVGLASLDGFREGNPDLLGRGAIYGNAVSSVGAELAGATSAIVRRHWADCAFTWILLDGRCMVTIYTLHFDGASAADVKRANAQIVAELRAAGFPTYRLDIDSAPPAGAEEILGRLKSALDPMGIISPGRYQS
ncbi:MAG TPA: hypothetical protein VIJ19_05415, partial [Opitutaceae bacterium]